MNAGKVRSPGLPRTASVPGAICLRYTRALRVTERIPE
jgi:hypothetical protein